MASARQWCVLTGPAAVSRDDSESSPGRSPSAGSARAARSSLARSWDLAPVRSPEPLSAFVDAAESVRVPALATVTCLPRHSAKPRGPISATRPIRPPASPPFTSPCCGGIDHNDEPTPRPSRISESGDVQVSWMSPARRRAGERAAGDIDVEHVLVAGISLRLANASPPQSVQVSGRMPVGDGETIMPVTAGSPEGRCVTGSARGYGVVGFVVRAVRQRVDSQSHRGSYVPALPAVDS
jgi:hypothetical protein